MYAGNKGKIPFGNDTEDALLYTTTLTYDSVTGWVGIGGVPTRDLDIRPSTGPAGFRLRSSDDQATMVIDGFQQGSDGTFADISFRNGGDSIAIIKSSREGFDDAGGLCFKHKTQAEV